MTRFGLKLAQDEGYTKAYKDIRKLAKANDFELIRFEDEEVNSDFKFYTIELMKYKELEYIGYGDKLDEVIRDAEDFLKGEGEDE